LDSITFNDEIVQPLRRAGDSLLFDASRSWKDIAHTRVPLPSVKNGRNTLVIKGKKLNVSTPSGVSHRRTQPGIEPQETQLEDILICGRFRLQTVGEGQFRIADYSAPCRGDLTSDGFPFYAGRVVYRASIGLEELSDKQSWLHLHDLNAASARVRINGKHVSTLLWPPHLVDLSSHLRIGKNEIEIELATTLNNALGPVRFAGALERRRVVPRDFFDMSRCQPRYDLMPLGLRAATITVEGEP
jgi:hypothetical protein